ncbi:Crossover junction endoribonuclease [Leptospira biflexa serovar Patoc strain 'Patoc 1 (Ames)']|uniref:Crossover junction endodeoxyribonuclease RuvC n=1 Tax=Leptospira biflexa serovar Patoc (strain Patoc 1 / ATCC 23582 / Paris) TaxID=456481 RepID=B0SR91_LEPBP|nr:crossover junction endodeoxyribonuclease RuvC [Leptospira biflexa]ABZ95672.1 Crossover junction endoribonuclease [Leptospira biflexa serovar Patoc strain 'Patoc 1 (Ames)']ABZ99383.1 Putative crossover junction endodeoxyribonuclease RuvC (Holliday junction nuclease ruvC) [Leptospira biflexa serovar Patoc strain 'Patoc 1 (Paris)']
MKIIGIDPGSHRVGYAVLSFPEGMRRNPELLAYGTIEVAPKTPSPVNLLQIRSELQKILSLYQPEHAAVEELFFVQNTTTGMKVSESRGVILLTLGENQIPMVSLTATQIKKGISAKGNATKKEVRAAIQMILGFKDLKGHDDSWDAIACAFVGRSLV